MKSLLVTLAILVSSSSPQEILSEGMTKFTTQFLNELELSSSSNFLFSPYSLHSVFSQVMFGARGQSLSQLESLLGVRATSDVLDQYRSLQLGLGRGSAQLNTGNELAVAVGFKPKSSYNQLLGNAFNSRISEYDFAGNRASAVKQINDLVSQRTEGKIQDLLLEQDVDSFTKLILINVIYFKGEHK
jgi:serine protease inhibitor